MARADSPAAAVRNYLDAFNQSDPQGMAAAFDPEGSILDGMAPHAWHGPAAPLDWYRDVMAESEHVGASDYLVSLGEPLHNEVTGDRAYFVAPASMSLTLNGQKITQTGSTFTVALKRTGGDWKIASWAWSKGRAGG
jgi:ketosteroid isomerase-like protein